MVMTRRSGTAKEPIDNETRTKAESPLSVRLYQPNDSKVRKRAQREGVSMAQVVSDIVDEYYAGQSLLPNYAERQEALTLELQTMREEVSRLREELHTQRLFMESYGTALNAQYALLQVLLQSISTTQKLCTHYVVDPHIKLLKTVDPSQIIAALQHPNSDWNEMTNFALQGIRQLAQVETTRLVNRVLGRGETPESEVQQSPPTAPPPLTTEPPDAPTQPPPAALNDAETVI